MLLDTSRKNLASMLSNVQIHIPHVLLIVAASPVIYVLGLVVYRLWFHPLAKLPGPRLWAITDLPYVYSANISGTNIYEVARLHQQYGPMIRIGPNRIALDGAIGWPQVFAHRPKGVPEFPKSLRNFQESVSLIQAPQDVHRRQRRVLAHAFSDSALKEQESIIMLYVHLLLARVQEHAECRKPMDVVKWLNYATFDIIGDLAFADSFHCLQHSDFHPIVSGILQGVRGDAFARASKAYPLLSPLLKLIFGQKQDSTEILGFAAGKAKARMELGIEPLGRRDFVTYMMQRSLNEESMLSAREIVGNAYLLLAAGSETTASALSGFFFYVGNTPRVKLQLMDEIRRSFKDESQITTKAVSALEYLHATLEETLRVYPPAAATPPRMSPGAEINSHYIPYGTTVHVTQWSTFRNPDHFHEPEGFFPERWLKKPHPLYEPQFGNDNHAVFKPFSFGPRDCIGKNLAYAEMHLITARLLYQFDFELLPDQGDWHSNQAAFIVWDKGPLNVRFTARTKDI